jgi:hypothetical protein
MPSLAAVGNGEIDEPSLDDAGPRLPARQFVEGSLFNLEEKFF